MSMLKVRRFKNNIMFHTLCTRILCTVIPLLGIFIFAWYYNTSIKVWGILLFSLSILLYIIYVNLRRYFHTGAQFHRHAQPMRRDLMTLFCVSNRQHERRWSSVLAVLRKRLWERTLEVMRGEYLAHSATLQLERHACVIRGKWRWQ